MARGTGRKEDAQNIFVLCRNLVFSKICSQKTQRACLRHCVRSLPRLLDTSSKETSHPCHRILNNELYPANVRRVTRRHLESHNVIYGPTWSLPKKTHTTEREPSIASEPIGLGGSRPIGQPGSHKLTLVTNRGGFDFIPIYKPYSGQRN
jgi:hypothetical protein